MEEEIWKDIIEYPNYQISNLGKVKSKQRITNSGRNLKEKIMSLEKTRLGYLRVQLCKENNKKHISVHRLVAKYFILNPSNHKVVNHKDKNPENNYYLNLEWVSVLENNCHKIDKTKTTSRYIGVSWYPNRNLWRSTIFFNSKVLTLGYFMCEFKAYLVRCAFEKEKQIINKYS